ncbi:MAG: 30S ribosomal protein S6 [Candidatus Aminicenantes bacterium]|nr:30S ribosomal protein S6 [Candidatus Aminicenantes bacterium]
MRQYETVFLISPNLEEEETAKIITQISGIISKKKGKLIREDRWGKKKLAYPIKKFEEAFYVFFHYEGDSDIPFELEKRFKQTEAILRFLTVKKETRENVRKKRKGMPAEEEVEVPSGREEIEGPYEERVEMKKEEEMVMHKAEEEFVVPQKEEVEQIEEEKVEEEGVGVAETPEEEEIAVPQKEKPKKKAKKEIASSSKEEKIEEEKKEEEVVAEEKMEEATKKREEPEEEQEKEKEEPEEKKEEDKTDLSSSEMSKEDK